MQNFRQFLERPSDAGVEFEIVGDFAVVTENAGEVVVARRTYRVISLDVLIRALAASQAIPSQSVRSERRFSNVSTLSCRHVFSTS